MIKLDDFYDKVKLPVNEELLNKLLEKYFSIPFKNLNLSSSSLENYKITHDEELLTNELYNQINMHQGTNVQTAIIKEVQNSLFYKINQDYVKAGKPFNPTTHNGITNPLNEQAGWITFKSWNLLGGERIHHNDQVHRLYISVSNNDKMDFANELYDEFKRHNIPFYFKVDYFDEDRSDKVVIYTSTQLLEKTLGVLNNIEKRRPDLMRNCNSPSIITGKVTDKIGYASEIINQRKTNEKPRSYTQIICKSFTDAMETIINEYIQGSIPMSINNIYSRKLKEYEQRGYKLEISGKKRIAAEVLAQYDPNFKIKVLNVFRTKIQEAGLDLNNMCFSIEVKKQIQNQARTTRKVDIFDPKVLNEEVILPNGTKLTIDEYLKINKVWSFIPLDATVTLGINGKTMSGKEFIEGIIKQASYFNTLEDLFKYYNVTVNRKNNVQKVKQNDDVNKEIKSYSLEEVEYLFRRYNLIKDNNGEYKVIDIKTKIIYETKNLVEKVKFAHTWVMAARYERSLNTPDSTIVTDKDYDYAFNTQAKEVYDKIMSLASIYMNGTGVLLDPKTLENDITKYVTYKYAKSIVRGLCSKEKYKESFRNWLKMANNIPVIEENQNIHR